MKTEYVSFITAANCIVDEGCVPHAQTYLRQLATFGPHLRAFINGNSREI